MRYLKMLGLAAVAAMALTAFLGAGSASATVLCKTTLTTGCAAAGWDYGVETEIKAELQAETEAILNGFWTNVNCKKSTVAGKTTTTGGANETVKGNISTLTFTECKCAGGAVGTAHVTVITNGSLEVHHITGTHEGTLTGSGTKVTINCTPLGSTCTFGSGTGLDIGRLTWAESGPALLHANAEVVHEGTGEGHAGIFVCGTSAVWEATYNVTPEKMTVAES